MNDKSKFLIKNKRTENLMNQNENLNEKKNFHLNDHCFYQEMKESLNDEQS